jgi:hypothetical protein
MSHSESSSMPPDTDLAVAIAKIEAMSGDMAEVKATMRELASAVSKLAVIEERQSSINGSIDRAFKEISTTNTNLQLLAGRVATLELAQPLNKQTNDWVGGAVKYILVLVLGAFLSGLWPKTPAAPVATPPAIVGK